MKLIKSINYMSTCTCNYRLFPLSRRSLELLRNQSIKEDLMKYEHTRSTDCAMATSWKQRMVQRTTHQ